MRFSFLFLLFISYTGFAQNIETIPKAAAQEDFLFLKESIKTYLPAPDVYNDPVVFEKLSDSLYQSIDNDLNILDFHKLICRLIASANEGHFSIGTNEDSFRKGFFDNSFHYLPLDLYFLEDRAIIESDNSGNPAIESGDEILSINGKMIADLKQEISDYLFVDGEISTYAEIQINSQFPYYYYWFVERPDSFEITYRPKIKFRESKVDRAVRKVVLHAMNRDDIQTEHYKDPKNMVLGLEPSIEDVYNLKINNKTAILRLRSFDWKLVEKYKLEAKELYEEIFTRLKEQKIEHLIIDLKYNTGGRIEFASEMIPFIMKEERKGVFRESISWKGKKKIKKFPKRDKLVFTGNIYVLINGKTFSAAASLASYLKEFGSAKLIGQESGSRYEGYAAGSSQTVYLPNTNIRVAIPRYWISFPKFKRQETINRGLIPDYTVRYSFNKRWYDLETELVLKLIEEELP